MQCKSPITFELQPPTKEHSMAEAMDGVEII